MLMAAGMCCGTFALTGWCRYQRAALMSPGRWSAAITVSRACLGALLTLAVHAGHAFQQMLHMLGWNT